MPPGNGAGTPVSGRRIQGQSGRSRTTLLFGPVVLGVLPLRFVASLRQQMHAAIQVARIEVLLVNPLQEWHVFVFRLQLHLRAPRSRPFHVLEEPAHEIGDGMPESSPRRITRLST